VVVVRDGVLSNKQYDADDPIDNRQQYRGHDQGRGTVNAEVFHDLIGKPEDHRIDHEEEDDPILTS
jgi:hypothetical protein